MLGVVDNTSKLKIKKWTHPKTSPEKTSELRLANCSSERRATGGWAERQSACWAMKPWELRADLKALAKPAPLYRERTDTRFRATPKWLQTQDPRPPESARSNSRIPRRSRRFWTFIPTPPTPRKKGIRQRKQRLKAGPGRKCRCQGRLPPAKSRILSNNFGRPLPSVPQFTRSAHVRRRALDTELGKPLAAHRPPGLFSLTCFIRRPATTLRKKVRQGGTPLLDCALCSSRLGHRPGWQTKTLHPGVSVA